MQQLAIFLFTVIVFSFLYLRAQSESQAHIEDID